MRRLILLPNLLLFVFCASVLAAPASRDFRGYDISRGDSEVLTNSDFTGFTKSGIDTFCMLSHIGAPNGDELESYAPGPGNSFAGDFQDDFFLPDWDEWTCVDYTQKDAPIWHIDTYQVINGSYSYWCGEDYASCGGGDPAGGYGNDYEEYIDYWAEVDNNAVTTNITLDAVINYDTEAGYDFLYLQYETAAGLQTAATFSGTAIGVVVNVGMSFDPGDYSPHPATGNPSCHLRWYADSDDTFSDADCNYPTAGHSQIDDIQVSGDNGVVTVFEDCEDQVEDIWHATYPPGVGAFCQIWPSLEELDDCCLNESPQAAFIDDGVVVPGTGGYYGQTWTYGPGGFIVNPEGGLAGPQYHLQNEVWSPVLEWAGGMTGYDGAFIEFSVYRHLGLGPVWAGLFYIWHVRGTSSTDPADIEYEAWQDRNFVYYGGPECTRVRNVVSDLLPSGRKWVQMALGVYELGWAWGWEGVDASPSPYFDDARFCAFTFYGPAIATREIDIAQDDFPENGDINCADPCGMNVRFDMANDISLQTEPYMYHGDSICFDIVAVRYLTTMPNNPELCYRLDPNPLFDGCRSVVPPGPGNTSYRGCTPGDTARSTGASGGHVIRDRFCFDLPDTGFFYPGDQIHYYIRAIDDGPGAGVTTLPGDTTGFSHFPCTGDPNQVFLRYPSSYVVRALPTIKDFGTCWHPSVLWWNDFGNRGLEPEWMHTWWQLACEERCNFDIYYTNGPSSGVGNGLGGRATSTQLLGYDVIVYSSGDLDQFTISDVNYEDDGGDDIGVLEGGFDTGEKGLFLCGNNLVTDLNNRSAATIAWEDKYIQVELVSNRHDELLGQWTPSVQRYPHNVSNPVFHCATRWTVDSYCNPISRHIDLVNAEGVPGKVAEFLDPSCSSDQYPFAAAVYNDVIFGVDEGQVIYLPYDLGYIIDDTACGGNTGYCNVGADRGEVLRDAFYRFRHMVGSNPDVPEAKQFRVDANYPNPFNPETVIEYFMPKSGPLAIKVYNVRGELVRTLIDEMVSEGQGKVAWDGTDTHGVEVSSGVYFYKTTALGKTTVQKMALIK